MTFNSLNIRTVYVRIQHSYSIQYSHFLNCHFSLSISKSFVLQAFARGESVSYTTPKPAAFLHNQIRNYDAIISEYLSCFRISGRHHHTGMQSNVCQNNKIADKLRPYCLNVLHAIRLNAQALPLF